MSDRVGQSRTESKNLCRDFPDRPMVRKLEFPAVYLGFGEANGRLKNNFSNSLANRTELTFSQSRIVASRGETCIVTAPPRPRLGCFAFSGLSRINLGLSLRGRKRQSQGQAKRRSRERCPGLSDTLEVRCYELPRNTAVVAIHNQSRPTSPRPRPARKVAGVGSPSHFMFDLFITNGRPLGNAW